MAKEHLNPAATAIAKLGGPDRVSEITGKHISRIYRWMYAKARGGTGGRVPQDDAQKMLEFAKREGIDLSPADFFSPSTEAAE